MSFCLRDKQTTQLTISRENQQRQRKLLFCPEPRIEFNTQCLRGERRVPNEKKPKERESQKLKP